MPHPHPLSESDGHTDETAAPAAARFLRAPNEPEPKPPSQALAWLNEPEWTEPGEEPKTDAQLADERQQIIREIDDAIATIHQRAKRG